MKYFEGKITLETRDARTGKLCQRVESTNFVAQAALRYMNWLQRSMYKEGLTTAGASDTDYQPSPVFDHIMLTDSTMAADAANEWMMPGALVGWANKSSYSGVDTLRGTPNTTQLDAQPGYTKWVFDWPTNAANGTIGSVGFGKAVYADSVGTGVESFFALNGTVEEYRSTTSAWKYFARANSVLAFGHPGTGIAISVLDGVYAQTTTFNVNGQFSSVEGLAWDSTGGKLWVLGTNSGTKRVAAYETNGSLSIGPVDLSTSRTYAYLAHDGTNLWSTVTSGQEVTFYRLSPADGTDVSNFVYTMPIAVATMGLCFEPTYQRLWLRTGVSSSSFAQPGRRSYLASFDATGNQQTPNVSLQAWLADAAPDNSEHLANVSSSSTPVTCDFDIVDAYQFAIATSFTSNRVAHFRPDGMGTRALVTPTPVTKTDSQTLKLVYQINYS